MGVEAVDLKDGSGSVVAMPPHAQSVYEQEEVAKFLATSSEDGTPNVVLIVSQIPVDPGRIAFGEFMMVKTRRNLDVNPRVASLTVTDKLRMAGFKGDLVEWVQSGPYIDRINSIPFFRYNAYAGIHNAGVVEIRKMLHLPEKVSYPRFAADYAEMQTLARTRRIGSESGVEIPASVAGKFNQLMAIKVLAYNDDDGYPNIVPILSTVAAEKGVIRFKSTGYNSTLDGRQLPLKAAVNVLTLDMLSYQLKGELVQFEKSLGFQTGVFLTREIYSCVPPLMGERII